MSFTQGQVSGHGSLKDPATAWPIFDIPFNFAASKLPFQNYTDNRSPSRY